MPTVNVILNIIPPYFFYKKKTTLPKFIFVLAMVVYASMTLLIIRNGNEKNIINMIFIHLLMILSFGYLDELTKKRILSFKRKLASVVGIGFSLLYLLQYLSEKNINSLPYLIISAASFLFFSKSLLTSNENF